MTIARPLEGITVLDLGQVYNGPYCGFLLAQAGARVIKVESPAGETLRRRAATTSQSYPFALLNGGKQSLTLNFKHERGRELLRQLVAHADVLVENFAPGTLVENGLGSDILLDINPRLVYGSGTGFGDSGPYRDFLGMDITLQAISGMMSITGEGDAPPLKAGAAVCDFLGGVHLYAGIVSALYRREQTGLGGVVDISMQDCMFPPMATAVGAYFYTGERHPRTGNRHPALSAAPYNVYPARDGYVALICIRDQHWHKLCSAMQRPELEQDERYRDMATRSANMEALDQEVSAWTEGLSKAEIFSICQRHGVISAPVQEVDEVVADPHLHQRGSLHWSEHPSLGKVALCSTPLRFKHEPAPKPCQAAALGEHTREILSEFLGLDSETLDALHRAGAI